MSGRVTVVAHAKVNLHLAVLGRRADVFHALVSLMQAVSLADTIELRRRGAAGALRIRGRFPFAPGENIVTRTVAAWREATGLTAGLEARVDKRIPIGAGLGGGSADAAGTLRGLAALFAEEGPRFDEAAAAAALGSDVPFFLGGGASVAEGRGELMRTLEARVDYGIVAVSPAVAVSTREAYRWLDEDGVTPALTDGAALARAYREESADTWPFSNSFDGPVIRREPAIAEARCALAAAGARSARLTGSGSTLIAVFGSADEAAACAGRLAGGPLEAAARALRPLDSSPVVVYYG